LPTFDPVPWNISAGILIDRPESAPRADVAKPARLPACFETAAWPPPQHEDRGLDYGGVASS
jgi:hypothetical protein